MKNKRNFTFALAGNANVGKSVIFNQLTGLNQITGNWPGKTVERAEGTLHFGGQTIKILDLPGIYSLSTFSIEEIVARDYIALERPDVIINIVDSSLLERNLYFTIQLLELEAPMIMALNQVDFAAKKGLRIDVERLSNLLGIPVVPTVAITGTGINELLSAALDVATGKTEPTPLKVQYGKEIEENLGRLEATVRDRLHELCRTYPARWVAIKLIEKDDDITNKVEAYENGDQVLAFADAIAEKLEQVHGHKSMVVMVHERYGIASSISRKVTELVAPPRITFEEKLSAITAHRTWGYPILALVMAVMFTVIFLGGGYLVGVLEILFEDVLIPIVTEILSSILSPELVELISGGVISGVAAGITIALPYIVPFYVILAFLEDSGYLPRAAFLMDNLMHKIGLHGKAFIPLLLGYGCNVPACVGCRIMETDRERFLAGFVVVLIPCAARTVVILGLVGSYVGIHAALALYAFNLILVFVLGRLAFKALPGEPVGLVMEMPSYKKPSIRNVLTKTWVRTKDFVYIAFPLIIGGSIVLEALRISGLIWPIADFMSPLVGGWLGLPPKAGIPLIFGILRKELTLILLAGFFGTFDFGLILTNTQMMVFALVTMIYIPCIATIAVLWREFGWRKTSIVVIVDIWLALLIGGIANQLLLYMNF
jgi:ferrous iron transport protein B